MLQSRPMAAPDNTWANAQTLVPDPTVSLSQRPSGWTKTSATGSSTTARSFRSTVPCITWTSRSTTAPGRSPWWGSVGRSSSTGSQLPDRKVAGRLAEPFVHGVRRSVQGRSIPCTTPPFAKVAVAGHGPRRRRTGADVDSSVPRTRRRSRRCPRGVHHIDPRATPRHVPRRGRDLARQDDRLEYVETEYIPAACSLLRHAAIRRDRDTAAAPRTASALRPHSHTPPGSCPVDVTAGMTSAPIVGIAPSALRLTASSIVRGVAHRRRRRSCRKRAPLFRTDPRR